MCSICWQPLESQHIHGVDDTRRVVTPPDTDIEVVHPDQSVHRITCRDGTQEQVETVLHELAAAIHERRAVNFQGKGIPEWVAKILEYEFSRPIVSSHERAELPPEGLNLPLKLEDPHERTGIYKKRIEPEPTYLGYAADFVILDEWNEPPC
jgi:hypothetical protein